MFNEPSDETTERQHSQQKRRRLRNKRGSHHQVQQLLQQNDQVAKFIERCENFMNQALRKLTDAIGDLHSSQMKSLSEAADPEDLDVAKILDAGEITDEVRFKLGRAAKNPSTKKLVNEWQVTVVRLCAPECLSDAGADFIFML